jgi:hypothetical protein
VIGEDGKVESANASNAATGSLGVCVTSELRGWTFDKSSGGKVRVRLQVDLR